MNKILFKKWLIEVRGLKESVAGFRVTNCKAIEKVYGNLEEHYYLDGCKAILSQLKYTKKDERENNEKQHLINIDGNVYNGTSTLRQALSRYIEFMNDKSNYYV
jgi:hypothetical protein